MMKSIQGKRHESKYEQTMKNGSCRQHTVPAPPLRRGAEAMIK
jgi:hypothetical protein